MGYLCQHYVRRLKDNRFDCFVIKIPFVTFASLKELNNCPRKIVRMRISLALFIYFVDFFFVFVTSWCQKRISMRTRCICRKYGGCQSLLAASVPSSWPWNPIWTLMKHLSTPGPTKTGLFINHSADAVEWTQGFFFFFPFLLFFFFFTSAWTSGRKAICQLLICILASSSVMRWRVTTSSGCFWFYRAPFG